MAGLAQHAAECPAAVGSAVHAEACGTQNGCVPGHGSSDSEADKAGQHWDPESGSPAKGTE